MCGIAGVVGRRDPEAVRRMVDALAHRGPDAEGLWSDGPDIGLGHRRLAIISPTDEGRQPMQDATGRLHIVFNGEIYNYRELREELQARGALFATATDTEVILAAWAAWDSGALARLRGMFAFALVDLREPGRPRVVLARDRLGIKPLLYKERGRELWFASELRALLLGIDEPRRISVDGLADFLLSGAPRQPESFVEGVHSLEPGHYLEWRAGRATLHRYWDLHAATEALRTEARGWSRETAMERLRAALLEATRYHLVSDVPMGAFLSGGVDSATVVSLMMRVTNRPVDTYSVGFSSTHAELSELPFARQTAEALGCRHHEVVLADEDIAAAFEHAVRAMDRPCADGINTWFVSRAARVGVKVALSGLGGDELFCGYNHFLHLAAAAGERIPTPTLRARIRLALATRRCRRLPLEARLPSYRTLVGLDFHRDVAVPRLRERGSRLIAANARVIYPDADSIQQTTHGEISGYLLNILLRDTDIMSMAHGLEVRPMLLDHPLAELAYALPGPLRLDGGKLKGLFRAAVAPWIPPAILQRPKTGFALPYARWMSDARVMRARAAATLTHPATTRLLTRDCLHRWTRHLQEGRPPFALWAMMILVSWLEQERFDLADALE